MTGGGKAPFLAAPLADGQCDALFQGWTAYKRIALAVSGGADSTALLVLAQEWRDRTASPPELTVLTVDHGLRAEAGQEAAWVKNIAASLGLPQQTLIWPAPKPQAGLQAAARAARYGLMLGFCRSAQIEALATAHTANDQAETLLMRLARGSGLDGLAGIGALSARDGIAVLRPLLSVPRVRLETSLRQRGQAWIEDPSNRDKRYERVRLREALQAAAALGLTAEKLALSAHRLGRARLALDAITGDVLQHALHVHPAGYGEMALATLRETPEDIGMRAISRMAGAFGGGERVVRLARIEALHRALISANPGTATLGGCVFTVRRSMLRIAREFGRIDASRIPVPTTGLLLWDSRFTVSAPQCESGLRVGPLGPEGVRALRAVKGWIALPAQVAHALPALWRDATLVYAPFAIFADGPPLCWRHDCHATFANVGLLRGKAPPGQKDRC